MSNASELVGTVGTEHETTISMIDRFRAQHTARMDEMRNSPTSLFNIVDGEYKVTHTILRAKRFDLNNGLGPQEFIVLGFKAVGPDGNTKIIDTPAFVKNANEAMTIAENHKIDLTDVVGEEVAFKDLPWKPVKKAFKIDITTSMIKGVRRVVLMTEA